LVWRNWDLAQVERIADALRAKPAAVQALAASMQLGPAHVPGPHDSRLRFKALRRNWDFVTYSQIETLIGIGRDQIRDMLSHDAFYSGHLGPKPDVPEIRVTSATSQPGLDHFLGLTLAASGEEQRFGFIRELSAPAEPSRRPDSGDFSPRIAFPYFAAYADVRGEDDFASYYPAGLLTRMANAGVNAIWLHAKLRDLAPFDVFPEFGKQSSTRCARLNRIIAEAKRCGLAVYLYLNEPMAMPDAFFSRHPEIRGAPGRPGDGLHSLCTSTGVVRKYLVEGTAELFRRAPELEGVLLITPSENPTNWYSLTRRSECPRCRRRPGAEVIGEVIEKGIRSVKPAANVVAWDWSWGIIEDDPQEQIIAGIPRYGHPDGGFRTRHADRTGRRRGQGGRVFAIHAGAVAAGLGPHPAGARARDARHGQSPGRHYLGSRTAAFRPCSVPGGAQVRGYSLGRRFGGDGVMDAGRISFAQLAGGRSILRRCSRERRFRRSGSRAGALREDCCGRGSVGMENIRRGVRAVPVFEFAGLLERRQKRARAAVVAPTQRKDGAHPQQLRQPALDGALRTGARGANLHEHGGAVAPRCGSVCGGARAGSSLAAARSGGRPADQPRGLAVFSQHLQPGGIPLPACLALVAIRSVGQTRWSAADALVGFREVCSPFEQQIQGNPRGPGVRPTREVHYQAQALARLLRDEIAVARAFLEICRADSRVGFESSLQYFTCRSMCGRKSRPAALCCVNW
jgi:hypothetical protein